MARARQARFTKLTVKALFTRSQKLLLAAQNHCGLVRNVNSNIGISDDAWRSETLEIRPVARLAPSRVTAIVPIKQNIEWRGSLAKVRPHELYSLPMQPVSVHLQACTVSR